MKKLTSIFTDDMDVCMFTGNTWIDRHHVFGGSNRKYSEKYGFIAPLRKDLHPNGVFADDRYRRQVDEYLKRNAQEYFEKHYGSREEFMKIFGRSYL